MNAEKVWLLGAVPLWNSCRWTLYGRRRRQGPSRFPYAKSVVWAFVLVFLIYVTPLCLAGPVKSFLNATDVSPGAFGALAWVAVGGLGLLYGFIAPLGCAIGPILARDEVLRALPLQKRELVAGRLLALELEGMFWVVLVAYPAVVEYVGLLGGGAGAQLWALFLTLLFFAFASGAGIGLAHLFMLLRPSANRAKLLANVLCIVIVGTGLAIAATRHSAPGGRAPFHLATAVSDMWLSPARLPLSLSTAAPSAATCAGLALLLLCAAVTTAGAFAAMMASYEKLFTPQGKPE